MSLVTPAPVSTLSSSAPSSSSQKRLTKKQQKALAFRDRKSGKRTKGSSKDDDLAEMDANAIPAMEDQDLASLTGGEVEVAAVLDQAQDQERGKKGDTTSKGKGKRKGEDGDAKVEVAAKLGGKRKREQDEEGEGEGVAMDVDGGVEVEKGQPRKKKKQAGKEGEDSRKQKFILFVGTCRLCFALGFLTSF
jgi:nucleolar protein 6